MGASVFSIPFNIIIEWFFKIKDPNGQSEPSPQSSIYVHEAIVTNMHITLRVVYTHAVAQGKVSRSNATRSLQRGSRRRATQLSSEWTRRDGHTSQHHASLNDLAMETVHVCSETARSSSGCVRPKHHISTIEVQSCDLMRRPKYRIGITE